VQVSHENHQWLLGENPPILRAHSVAKHRVLRSYLEKYVSVLTSDPRRDQLRLTLVDGFAGGGLYLHHRTGERTVGSPLIMLEAMKTAEFVARERRKKPFHLDVQYIFIERDNAARDFLTHTIQISEFGPLLGSKIEVLGGEFLSHLGYLVDHVRKRNGRSIFSLDQFGYKDAPLPAIRRVLTSLPKAEILLTFAIDHLIDYLGANEATRKRIERLELELTGDQLRAAKEQPHWRRLIQTDLHGQVFRGSGAKYFTPFFIRSEDSHRDLWLIHLSGHHRARDVMVQLHWQLSTCFSHYGGAGLQMLGYDQSLDASVTQQTQLFAFDDEAKALTLSELQAQFPARLAKYRDGIPFQQLFTEFTNETPATSEMMKAALKEAIADGELSLKDSAGSTAKRPRNLKDSDIILPSKQRRLFLPPNRET
jgi:three-Cys-motif partner protein